MSKFCATRRSSRLATCGLGGAGVCSRAAGRGGARRGAAGRGDLLVLRRSSGEGMRLEQRVGRKVHGRAQLRTATARHASSQRGVATRGCNAGSQRGVPTRGRNTARSSRGGVCGRAGAGGARSLLDGD
jgi:hypothetical protein